MDKQDDIIQQGYVINACDAIKIIFVTKQEDLLPVPGNPNNPVKYKPAMAHQIFAEEAIYGYSGLSIHIYYLVHSGYCYFEISYNKCYTEDGAPSPANDNIIQLLEPWFPSFTQNKSEICELLAKDDQSYMFGTIVNSFSNHHLSTDPATFTVTSCFMDEPGFISFHKRFQSLIIMYIDAANFIDFDERWMIYYLYKNCHTDSDVSNYPIGFCTIYKFWKYPDKVRARISQFFIIPPYQHMGLGSKLLDVVYESLRCMDEVSEITVESPNKAFTILRDRLDLKHIMVLPEYSSTNVVRGYSNAMQEVALAKLKLCERQSKHLYQIIRYYTLHTTKKDNYLSFKANVIAHLEHELQRNSRRNYNISNTCKYLLPGNEKEKKEYLEEQFYIFLKEMQTLVKHLKINIQV